jgi:hypothetical protein
MLSSRQISEMIAAVLVICAKHGCDLRFVQTGGGSNGALQVYGVEVKLHKTISDAVEQERHEPGSALELISSLALYDRYPGATETMRDRLSRAFEAVFDEYERTTAGDALYQRVELLRHLSHSFEAIRSTK